MNIATFFAAALSLGLQQAPAPDACQQAMNSTNPETAETLLLRCARESGEEGWKSLAYINLGSLAFQQGRNQDAVDYYDQAELQGKSLYSDPYYHAFYSNALAMVGRTEDGGRQAERALEGLDNAPDDKNYDARIVFENIIEPLHQAGRSETLNRVLADYLAFDTKSWIDVVNRASILTTVEKFDQALPLARQGVELQPDHPATQNTLCYVLATLDRAGEAMTHCERAFSMISFTWAAVYLPFPSLYLACSAPLSSD